MLKKFESIYGWKYLACAKCKKKPKPTDPSNPNSPLFCDGCKKICENMTPRYVNLV